MKPNPYESPRARDGASSRRKSILSNAVLFTAIVYFAAVAFVVWGFVMMVDSIPAILVGSLVTCGVIAGSCLIPGAIYLARRLANARQQNNCCEGSSVEDAGNASSSHMDET